MAWILYRARAISFHSAASGSIQHPNVRPCVSGSAMTDSEKRTDIALAVLAGASIVGIVLIGKAA